MGEASEATGTIFAESLGSQVVREDESDLGHVEPRQATLFLIDASPAMFQNIPQAEESPFMKSILMYKNNLQMLCGFNRDDWMSLILFATTEWDKDPETENVLTVQKFQKVTLDMLQDIREKIAGHRNFFSLVSSSTTYPLHDALWHASKAFSSVKTVIITRKIVLLTCEDNPFADDPNERHRIRTRVSTFKNLGIDFRVIGLKNDFDHDKFYKELSIIATGMNPRSFRKLQLDDLEAEIQFPSRTISTIPWKFSKDVEIPVSIFTLSTDTKYPDWVYINRTTNEPLQRFTLYKKEINEEDEDEDNFEDEGKFNPNVVAAGGIAKFQVHGEKKLVFDVKEISTMFDHFIKGIELLCFKPIECDPMYHVESPKFLSLKTEDASESQKQLFATLIEKCEAKELMAVCRIAYRLHASPNVFYLYPSVKRVGFFVYKMAYEDHVRNLDNVLSNWIMEDNWKHRPSSEALQVFEKIVKKVRIRFDPTIFKNPKLGTVIANIEALALDLEEKIVPPDNTLPSQRVEERLDTVMAEYYQTFFENEIEEEEDVPAKRVKLIDNETMRNHIQMRMVEKLTVPQIKEFLKGFDVSTGGRKADLVQKVYELRNRL